MPVEPELEELDELLLEPDEELLEDELLDEELLEETVATALDEDVDIVPLDDVALDELLDDDALLEVEAAVILEPDDAVALAWLPPEEAWPLDAAVLALEVVGGPPSVLGGLLLKKHPVKATRETAVRRRRRMGLSEFDSRGLGAPLTTQPGSIPPEARAGLLRYASGPVSSGRTCRSGRRSKRWTQTSHHTQQRSPNGR